MSNSVTPWTAAHQAPLSTEVPRQEYWSALPFPTPGDLPDPGSQHRSPTLAGIFFTTEPPGALLLLFILLAIFFLFTGLLKKILYIVTKNFPLVFTFFYFFLLVPHLRVPHYTKLNVSLGIS